jgi:hypothetical protein
MLSQLMPQLAQMIMSEPQTASFCGELLKFAVAPFRAGRSLDGAIDDLVEQMKQKGDQPRGDDPVTAQNKTALQIEQMKVQAQQQSDNAKLQLQAQELRMKDQHKQAELANERAIALAKLQAAQSEDATDAAVQNQKMMESREAHQSQMIRNTQEMQLDQRKADLEIAAHQLKAQESAQRAAQPSFNMMTPRGRP